MYYFTHFTFKLFKLLNFGLLLELISRTSHFNNDLQGPQLAMYSLVFVKGPYNKEKSQDGVRRKRMYEGTQANKMSELTREKAIMVIKEVDKVLSHYTRRHSQREYLPAGFHLTDIYKEFRKSLAEDEPTPSTNWFYTLFNTNYKLGTHCPRNDL